MISALEAWAETAKYGSKAMEPYLERIMACAFLRIVDGKASIRNAAQAAMTTVATTFPADILLVAITKSLGSTKSAKGRAAVMEYSVAALGAGTLAGLPSRGTSLSAWVEACAKELTDRSPDVRKVAGAALEHVYKSMDSATVLAYITASSNAAAVKRALARGVPELASDLTSFQRNGGAGVLDAERSRRASVLPRSAPQSPGNSPKGGSACVQNGCGDDTPDSDTAVAELQQQAADICEAATGLRIGQAPHTVDPPVPPVSTPLLSSDAPFYSGATSSAREAAPIHIDHQEDSCAASSASLGPKAKSHESTVDVFVSSAKVDDTAEEPPEASLSSAQHQHGYATPPQHMPPYYTYAANAYIGTPGSTPGSEAPPAPLDPAVAEARYVCIPLMHVSCFFCIHYANLMPCSCCTVQLLQVIMPSRMPLLQVAHACRKDVCAGRPYTRHTYWHPGHGPCRMRLSLAGVLSASPAWYVARH